MPFQLQPLCGARRRRILRFEVDVVRDHQIEMAIAVVIDKRASCAPSRFRPIKATLLRFVAERAISQVVQENVMPPLGDEEIHVAFVIRIAGADSLPPAEVADAGFGGHVLKAKAAEIVIKMRRQRRPRSCAAGRPGQEKYPEGRRCRNRRWQRRCRCFRRCKSDPYRRRSPLR